MMSFVGAGRALGCTDKKTNDTLQTVRNVIHESNASALYSWASAAIAHDSSGRNEYLDKISRHLAEKC